MVLGTAAERRPQGPGLSRWPEGERLAIWPSEAASLCQGFDSYIHYGQVARWPLFSPWPPDFRRGNLVATWTKWKPATVIGL
jgi:hypothetical protein